VNFPYATAGLYSATSNTTGTVVNNNIESLVGDIVQGRKPLSAWDDGVKQWRSKGGDQMRKEYEEQHAARH
jgi:putative aldouronate transport system substrate-binding protein